MLRLFIYLCMTYILISCTNHDDLEKDADIKYNLGYYSSALKSYESCLQKDLLCKSAKLSKGACLIKLNRKQEGFKIMKQLFLSDNKNEEACLWLGQLYYDDKNMDSAWYYFSYMLFLDSSYRNYCNRGFVYMKLKQYNEAYFDFKKSTDLMSGLERDPRPYYGKGIAYYYLKEYKAAASCLDLAIICDHTFANAYQFRGMIRRKMGLLQEANQDFAKAKKYGADVSVKAEDLF